MFMCARRSMFIIIGVVEETGLEFSLDKSFAKVVGGQMQVFLFGFLEVHNVHASMLVNGSSK